MVRASCGHIRELSNEGEDSLGFSIDGSRVRCKYIPRDRRAKETIQKLKSAVNQVQEVVLATDPDREGETIAWHLKEELGLRQAPKRVVYSEITAPFGLFVAQCLRHAALAAARLQSEVRSQNSELRNKQTVWTRYRVWTQQAERPLGASKRPFVALAARLPRTRAR